MKWRYDCVYKEENDAKRDFENDVKGDLEVEMRRDLEVVVEDINMKRKWMNIEQFLATFSCKKSKTKKITYMLACKILYLSRIFFQLAPKGARWKKILDK